MNKILIALVVALTLTIGTVVGETVADTAPAADAHSYYWCGHYDKIDYGFGFHPNYRIVYWYQYTDSRGRHVHVYLHYYLDSWITWPLHSSSKYC